MNGGLVAIGLMAAVWLAILHRIGPLQVQIDSGVVSFTDAKQVAGVLKPLLWHT